MTHSYSKFHEYLENENKLLIADLWCRLVFFLPRQLQIWRIYQLISCVAKQLYYITSKNGREKIFNYGVKQKSWLFVYQSFFPSRGVNRVQCFENFKYSSFTQTFLSILLTIQHLTSYTEYEYCFVLLIAERLSKFNRFSRNRCTYVWRYSYDVFIFKQI